MEKIQPPSVPSFKNSNGEELPLDKISRKKVTLVTFTYSPQVNKFVKFFLYALVFIKIKYFEFEEEKIITITDERITFFYPSEVGHVTARFSSKQKFNEIIANKHSVKKRIIDCDWRKYQITFPTQNLKIINWE